MGNWFVDTGIQCWCDGGLAASSIRPVLLLVLLLSTIFDKKEKLKKAVVRVTLKSIPVTSWGEAFEDFKCWLINAFTGTWHWFSLSAFNFIFAFITELFGADVGNWQSKEIMSSDRKALIPDWRPLFGVCTLLLSCLTLAQLKAEEEEGRRSRPCHGCPERFHHPSYGSNTAPQRWAKTNVR